MYEILRLWIDCMENTNAYGFSTIGFVNSKEEAERICNLEFLEKKGYPLEYAFGYDKFVPRFKYKEVKNLENLNLKELKNIQIDH